MSNLGNCEIKFNQVSYITQVHVHCKSCAQWPVTDDMNMTVSDIFKYC
jgi:hypothetical protein